MVELKPYNEDFEQDPSKLEDGGQFKISDFTLST